MEHIVARYSRDGQECTVVLAGYGKQLTGTAKDIVAARELTDNLAKEIAADLPHEPVVVHLLDDSAIEFTRAYLDATLFDQQPGGKADRPPAGDAAPRRRGKRGKRDTGRRDTERGDTAPRSDSPESDTSTS